MMVIYRIFQLSLEQQKRQQGYAIDEDQIGCQGSESHKDTSGDICIP